MTQRMTLDEAIIHAEEVANTNKRLCETVSPAMQLSDYGRCAEEHEQLAEWLKELKQLREKTRWIPVSERLPELNELDTKVWKQKVMITGYLSFDDKKELFVSEEFINDVINNSVHDTVVTAWMPKPEPYKAESEV